VKADKEYLAQSQLFTLRGESVDALARTVDTQSSMAAAVKRQLVGQVIDQKYKLVSLLGEGGMGAVYKAHHLMLNKEVALKTFRSPNLTEESWNRFQREAQAIARLTHPNIVQVFDFGVGEDNVPYYTMECLTGEALADRMARRKFLPVDEAIRVYVQVCHGLTLAHSKGIIHRDMKPANIFMAKAIPGGPADTVKIVDFGIAGLATQSLDGQRLTATGTIFGSPFYMSPEQSLGQEITERSDIYSVGCSLFETLTGEPPFHGENAFATMMQHQLHAPPELLYDPNGVQFPQRLTGLIARMLAKNEGNRIQTFAEVASELEQIYHGEMIKIQTGVQPTLAPNRGDNYSDVDEDEETGEYNATEADGASRKKTMVALVCAAVCLIGGAAGGFYYFNKQKPDVAASDSSLKTPEIFARSVHPLIKEESKPFLVRTDEEGRHFLFPDQSIGTIDCFWEHKTKRVKPPKDIEARGEVLVPANCNIALLATGALERQPMLFDRFGPDDISQLILDNRFQWADKHMAHISKLSGLKVLRINDTCISDKAITWIQNLKRLKNLNINHTFMTATGISKLDVLGQLDSLGISGIQAIRPILTNLGDTHKLNCLEVDGCSLKTADLEMISNFSKLKQLTIRSNSDVNNKNFAILAKLQNLERLSIEGTMVTADCLPTLQQFPKLVALSSELAIWSAQDKQRFKEALPKCSFRRAETSVLKSLNADNVNKTAQDLKDLDF